MIQVLFIPTLADAEMALISAASVHLTAKTHQDWLIHFGTWKQQHDLHVQLWFVPQSESMNMYFVRYYSDYGGNDAQDHVATDYEDNERHDDAKYNDVDY